jgi:hypothetical protein
MRTRLRGKFSLLFVALAVLIAIPAIALADQIANNLDPSVDADFEVMALEEGGSAQYATLRVIPTGGDGKPGCNLRVQSH